MYVVVCSIESWSLIELQCNCTGDDRGLVELNMLPPGLRFLPIPQLFKSTYLDGPFVECVDCGKSLDSSFVYTIQKRIVAGEHVFEMAMCSDCRGRLTETFSRESTAALHSRMAECFRARVIGSDMNPVDTECPGDDEGPTNPMTDEILLDRCLNYCVMCECPRETCHRYSLAGLFSAAKLVLQTSAIGQSPVMMCNDCESSMSSLVSQQTRDSWDRFIDEHFDGPPAIDVDSPNYSPVGF
ncbi:MAG: hypothetical protein KDA91_01150 [Planctomycetaceae bacterium]|nr:hypothetical protein [Planctomycetaceae bacterium]